MTPFGAQGAPAGLDAASAALAGTGTIHVAAGSPGGLLEALGAAVGQAAGTPAGRSAQTPEGPCRLAIIDPTPERVALARKVVQRGSPWRGRNDVWFTGTPLLSRPGPGEQGGRVAFLFPGFEPEPAGPVDDVADLAGLPRPEPSRLTAPHPPDEAIVNQAVDIVTGNRVLATALAKLGVHPNLFAGHSLGEWTAMIVSGMCGLEDMDRLFAPVRSGGATFPDVAYAALGCGIDAARTAIAGLDGVYLSHDNCPHQCVVCGPPDLVDRALAHVKELGVLGQVMAFRSGFHTPLLAGTLEAGRDGLAALNPARPALPVWSATSVAPYPEDPAALRDLISAHLLRPVRFRELIDALYAEGVRAFVQVGAGSLAGFVQDTLGSQEHLAIAAQVPARPALAQLARVLSALWVEGATADEAPEPVAPVRPVPLALPTDGTPTAHEQAPAREPEQAPAGAPEQAPALSTAGPVLAAFEATVAEAQQAMEAVMAAWRARSQPRPESARPRTVSKVFSLDTMPELKDHCLFRQAPGWADDADAFPVVPMTTLFEIMAEAAAGARPDGTQPLVVAITDVRAHRWLAVSPPVTVPVEAVPLTDGRIRVRIGGYAEGTVELAGSWPAPPHAGPRLPLQGERPPAADGRSLYADGWMFHGPGFQGVAAIDAFGDDGIRGRLTALPASGSLLDAAGQLAGHWAQAWAETDRLAFPVAVDAVRFFAPHPQRGDQLGCSVAVHAFTSEWLRVDIDVATARGETWARIEGWTCRRFATDEVTWPAVHTRPSEVSVGQHQAGGWYLVTDRWPDRASMEYTMRRYLSSAERAEFDSHNPRAQRAWLLGRIAAKDAARGWLWQHGSGPLWPAEFRVGNDPSGRPWIRRHPSRGNDRLSVSLAHTAGIGVAIARPAGVTRIGIDVESVATVTAAADAVRSVAFTETELDLLRRLSPAGTELNPLWMTRFWTAKEAAGKAIGTGLGGRRDGAEVRAIDGPTLLVATRAPNGQAAMHRVQTRVLNAPGGRPGAAAGEHVVAWTEEPVQLRVGAAPASPTHPRHTVRRR
ncbi:MAG TPA: acyltransferase domain-containing protein [Actinomycetota bacterium]|nr:acyltransferase domain-containing protein [Actinomycetota bacterium]